MAHIHINYTETNANIHRKSVRHLGIKVVESTKAAFSSPATSDAATIGSRQLVSQTLSSSEAALGENAAHLANASFT